MRDCVKVAFGELGWHTKESTEIAKSDYIIPETVRDMASIMNELETLERKQFISSLANVSYSENDVLKAVLGSSKVEKLQLRLS